MTAPRKAKTPQGRQAKGVFNTTHSATILADMLESTKTVLLAGKSIRLIDYLPEQRPHVTGAISELRDELPIRMGWVTVRESHLSQTGLRTLRYNVPGEFLREVGHAD
jgi:hypothetical protein